MYNFILSKADSVLSENWISPCFSWYVNLEMALSINKTHIKNKNIKPYSPGTPCSSPQDLYMKSLWVKLTQCWVRTTELALVFLDMSIWRWPYQLPTAHKKQAPNGHFRWMKWLLLLCEVAQKSGLVLFYYRVGLIKRDCRFYCHFQKLNCQ